MLMIERLLENLNPAQHEAVITTGGPLLVVAGAGSGKTRVLTTRVAYILAERLAAPYNILAVTFTNKAAREMKSRIIGLLGYEIQSLTVATFHSFCARLLRQEAEAIGYPSNFTIFDEDDAKVLIKNCLDELGLSRTQFTPQSIKRKISAAKNRMETASDFASKASGYFEDRVAKVYRRYEERLRQCAAFDFDDLIFHAVRLLGGRDDIATRYRNKLRYILVDEYQDTNQTQYQLLKSLVGPDKNICVVGDEDQSIYGWRGADITNILNFEKDFPGARVIKLEQNYRSTGIILKAASAVIANNTQRKEKVLWTELKDGDPLHLTLTDTAADEAAAVVGRIERENERYALKEMVILYRTNAQSRAFEEHLRRQNMPYQIIGGVAFYQRREIKDLLAYLRLIANPSDDVSFQRIINYPRRGLGETSVARLRQFAVEQGRSIYESLRELDRCDSLGARPRKLFGEFAALLEPYTELKKTEDVGSLTRRLVDELRLPEQLIEEDPVVGQGRVENIDEFIAAAEEFAASTDDPTLDNFLAEISLYTDIDQYDEIEDKLSLMTLHAAKGLEFEAVFVVGLEEGLFPLGRAVEEPSELEEERRLFYVGATRARRNLYLSLATSRGRFGEVGSIPSRFIKELPPALVETTDLRQHRGNNQNTFARRRPQPEPDTTGVHYEYEEDEILRLGRMVMHPTFGRGKVVGVEGSGEALRLEISFTGIGIKKIMARYARLKVIG